MKNGFNKNNELLFRNILIIRNKFVSGFGRKKNTHLRAQKNHFIECLIVTEAVQSEWA